LGDRQSQPGMAFEPGIETFKHFRLIRPRECRVRRPQR
jgi:hypothetical protein